MAIICNTYLKSSLFTYNDGVFTAEASDFIGSSPESLVYDDACDVGFYMVSERTGKEVLFVLWMEHRDREGEFTFAEYRPDPRKHHDLAHLSARIYND